MGSIPRLGRFPGGRNSNSLQYSCLENPKDRGVWLAKVHRGHKQSDMTEHAHTHTHTHEWSKPMLSSKIFFKNLHSEPKLYKAVYCRSYNKDSEV